MTTKEQERAALKKIRKIVEDLGPDSYLSFAFDGCFEDAESNMEDEAAYSMKSRLKSADELIESLEHERVKLYETIRQLEGQIENKEHAIKEKDIIIDDLQQRVAKLFRLTLSKECGTAYIEFLQREIEKNNEAIQMFAHRFYSAIVSKDLDDMEDETESYEECVKRKVTLGGLLNVISSLVVTEGGDIN